MDGPLSHPPQHQTAEDGLPYQSRVDWLLAVQSGRSECSGDCFSQSPRQQLANGELLRPREAFRFAPVSAGGEPPPVDVQPVLEHAKDDDRGRGNERQRRRVVAVRQRFEEWNHAARSITATDGVEAALFSDALDCWSLWDHSRRSSYRSTREIARGSKSEPAELAGSRRSTVA